VHFLLQRWERPEGKGLFGDWVCDMRYSGVWPLGSSLQGTIRWPLGKFCPGEGDWECRHMGLRNYHSSVSVTTPICSLPQPQLGHQPGPWEQQLVIAAGSPQGPKPRPQGLDFREWGRDC
jgi:hypothetical protein